MTTQFAQFIGHSFFPASALDQYALVATPQEALGTAVEVARAQYRAALAPDNANEGQVQENTA